MEVLQAEQSEVIEMPKPRDFSQPCDVALQITVQAPSRKRKQEPKNKYKPEDVDAALALFKGDRKLAAAKLGITVPKLRNIIQWNEFLHMKWSKHGTLLMAKLEAQKTADSQVSYHLSEANKNLLLQANHILKQTAAIEKRLERSEEARAGLTPGLVAGGFLPPPPPYLLTADEEFKLRNQLLDMFKEYRSAHKAYVDTGWVLAKIEVLEKRVSGTGGNKLNGKKIVGFVPKGGGPPLSQ